MPTGVTIVLIGTNLPKFLGKSQQEVLRNSRKFKRPATGRAERALSEINDAASSRWAPGLGPEVARTQGQGGHHDLGAQSPGRDLGCEDEVGRNRGQCHDHGYDPWCSRGLLLSLSLPGAHLTLSWVVRKLPLCGDHIRGVRL